MNAANRRSLFCDFAKAHEFDPLDASQWYLITKHQFLAFKVFDLLTFNFYEI